MTVKKIPSILLEYNMRSCFEFSSVFCCWYSWFEDVFEISVIDLLIGRVDLVYFSVVAASTLIKFAIIFVVSSFQPVLTDSQVPHFPFFLLTLNLFMISQHSCYLPVFTVEQVNFTVSAHCSSL